MLAALVVHYLEIYPEEESRLGLLLSQLKGRKALNDRKNFRGHVTAMAIVLSPNMRQLLLIRHKALGLWLPAGGHFDPEDSDPLVCAKREVIEETGVALARYLPLSKDNPLVPLDIDTHYIPARPAKNEPSHYHHDFRYVFVASNLLTKCEPREIGAAEWFDFEAPETAHIKEVINKLQTRKFIT